MAARILHVETGKPDPAAITAAAQILNDGGLVIFPTETVYGLGAAALKPDSVRAIFRAKGRPAGNPVIVHVPDHRAAATLAAAWPESARNLAERFWPGALTLVLPRTRVIPDAVTAGGSTVGIRVPAHPVARALLVEFGAPIAAPSANPSNRVSATDARHLDPVLLERVDLVLDAGPTPGGIESTVLDLTTAPPRVLRPGLISLQSLRTIVPDAVYAAGEQHHSGDTLPSPGMLPRHYAPLAKLELLPPRGAAERIEALLGGGLHVGWMALAPAVVSFLPANLTVVEMPFDPTLCAQRLFGALHELDAAGVAVIVAELPPDAPAWHAIRDRLRRAATPAPG